MARDEGAVVQHCQPFGVAAARRVRWARTHTRTHACAHTCTCIHARLHTYTHARARSRTRTRTHTHARTRARARLGIGAAAQPVSAQPHGYSPVWKAARVLLVHKAYPAYSGGVATRSPMSQSIVGIPVVPMYLCVRMRTRRVCLHACACVRACAHAMCVSLRACVSARVCGLPAKQRKQST